MSADEQCKTPPAVPKRPWKWLEPLYGGGARRLIGYTPEAVAAWKEEVAAYEAWHAENRKRLTELHAAAVQAVRDMGAETSYREQTGTRRGLPVYRTVLLKDALLPFFKATGYSRVDTSLEQEERHVRKEAEEKREQERRDATVAMRDRAITWLLARGLVLGKDFTSEGALSRANDIAAEEEIARRKAEGGLHEFSGDDSCESCGGWDGESHRCDCGNRRVSWVTTGWHTFEEPSVTGEAY